MESPISSAPIYEIITGPEGETVLAIRGRMDVDHAGVLLRELQSRFSAALPASLSVNLEHVEYLDDFGALVLVELKRMMVRGGRPDAFELVQPTDKVREILSLFDFAELGGERRGKRQVIPSPVLRLGSAIIQILFDIKALVSLVGDTSLALLYVLRHPKTLRWNDTLLYMRRVGVDAVPIVGLISLLLGLIMAFMSSVQLRQFGANVYVASLVSLAMTRELGPIMTAIVVAGRSGSAFAAEIGSMRINEEVDALFTMGFDTTRFLILPKLIASLLTVPLLTLFSDVFAILGGLIVSVTMLDLTTNAYMAQTVDTLDLFDVSWGFFKSAVFALLIAAVGCFRGFQVSGGPDEVGQATTSAVVNGIFLIVLCDSVFAVILSYWGG